MRKSIICLFIMILLANIAIGQTYTVQPITNPHPRLLMDANDIALMQQRVTDKLDPWYSAWLVVRGKANSALTRSPSPYTGSNSLNFYSSCNSDSAYAQYLAVAYLITGNTVYADRAILYLTTWAQATPIPGSNFDPNIRAPDSGMDVARSSMPFIWTYDLIYNYVGFSSEQKQAVEAWFRILQADIQTGINRWVSHGYYGAQYYQNHLAAHTMGMVLIGYALGDQALAQYAIDSTSYARDMLELIKGCILMEGQSVNKGELSSWPAPQDGEIYDRYRHDELHGLSYSHLTLILLAVAAEAAYHNGIDLFAYTASTGENLELPFTYYADFLRLQDYCLQSGFYCGEKDFLETAYIYTSVFEIAMKHYPTNKTIQTLLGSFNRSSRTQQYVGSAVLTHGIQLCSDAITAHKPGDLNEDCYVDFNDVVVFATDWLLCTDTDNSSCNGGMNYRTDDINNDYYVDFKDFALLAQNWLSCTDPTDTACDVE